MQTTLDIKKVVYATLHYRTLDNVYTRRTKPLKPTVHGQLLHNANEYATPFHSEYPGETRLEKALRLEIVDEWIPVLTLHLYSNRTLTFERTKATILWSLYNAYIYRKK